MKRVLLIAAILALIIQPTVAQRGHRTYLPFVGEVYRGENMSTWKIVVPEATTNYCLNPSAEIAGNFAAVGGGAVTRVNTTQFFDVYSYRLVTAANNEGASFTLLALSNNIHYVTMRVSGTLPTAWDWSLDNIAYTAPTLLEDIDGTWSLYGLQFSAAQANGSTLLYVRQNGAGAGDFNLDGIQVEQKTYWTTFCDGTREGCEWNGAEHASTSARSAVSRAGGRVQDLEDDYNFRIGSFISTGLPPVTNTVDSYAILPGGELNAIKVESRIFTLTGVIQGTSVSNLHANRQSLLDVLKPNAVPADASGPQPVRIRYTGATVQKQIAAHYQGGLETSIEATLECWERLAIRFLADDPYWYEIGDSAEPLDPEDTGVFRYCAGRLRNTGQWDDLGLTNNPTTNGTIWDIDIGPDRKVYFCGDFTGWDNNAGWDYVVRYDPAADTWERVGGAGDFANIVYALEFLPDGTLIAGGAFINAAGDPNADYLAQYDIATDTWSALAAGGTGTVLELHYSPYTGLLYFGGTFLNWNGNANSDYLASYALGVYSNVGIPNQGAAVITDVTAVTSDRTGVIYVGGNFVNFADVAAADYIARWESAAWAALGTGMDADVEGLDMDNLRGLLYAVGSFTTAGGVTADNAAVWNGITWTALGEGLIGTANGVDVMLADDGLLLVTGASAFKERWNGSAWFEYDFDPPPINANINAVMPAASDPVIAVNYDVYMGFSTTGNVEFAGLVTATNDGTVKAFPRIVIENTNGAGRSMFLQQIRNETTGLELIFDGFTLRDGEALTINLRPTNRSVISSVRGDTFDAIQPSSDFGTWALESGGNDVSLYVTSAVAVAIDAHLVWKDTYWSND